MTRHMSHIYAIHGRCSGAAILYHMEATMNFNAEDSISEYIMTYFSWA